MFEVVDNDDVLWKITVVLADSGKTSSHYLIAESDCLELQDIVDIYKNDPALLAEAIGRPHFVKHDMLLNGMVEKRLIKVVRHKQAA
jgi:hypothetical protein